MSRLTLFGVWRDFLHESDEVEQELGVVGRQLQIFAVFPEENMCYSTTAHTVQHASLHTNTHRSVYIHNVFMTSFLQLVTVFHFRALIPLVCNKTGMVSLQKIFNTLFLCFVELNMDITYLHLVLK